MKSKSSIVCMMVGILCTTKLFAATYGGGSGSAEDPYQVWTAAQMNTIGANPGDWGKSFKLMADIMMNGYTGTQYQIIGTSSTPFTGVFDGQNRTIQNLNYKTSDSTKSYGLFGNVNGSSASIKNLRLIRPKIQITGGKHCGCLVGYLVRGTITECSVVQGTVSGDSSIGGLVGSSESIISRSSFSGDVTGYIKEVGGLAGRNFGSIRYSYSTGNIGGTDTTGGIVGYSTGSIWFSYSHALVSGHLYIGGLVGKQYGGAITDCYFAGQMWIDDQGGGLVASADNKATIADSFWDIDSSGMDWSSAGTGKTTTEMQNPDTFRDASWDFVGADDGPSDLWAMPQPKGYPMLWWQLNPLPELPRFSGGQGTIDDPYRISTAHDLNSIGYNPRLATCHFRLVSDIDLSGIQYYPIGQKFFTFLGTFKGEDHIVTGLNIESSRLENTGFIGKIGSTGVVSGVHLRNPRITSSQNYVGGLAGALSSGRIENCSVEGGIINGKDYVGGLVGNMTYGSIYRSSGEGIVSAVTWAGGLVGSNSNGKIEECFSLGQVISENVAGGLVGLHYCGVKNRTYVTNCYSHCAVTTQTYGGGLAGGYGFRDGGITNSYATGTVTPQGEFGGLIGSSFYPDIQSEVIGSYWDTEASGVQTSVAGTGKTTAEMKTPATFSGWDFTNIWAICEGTNYPRLKWQVPKTDWACPDGVGLEDLVYLAGRWMAGTPETTGAADGNGDGKVEMGDFIILSEQWMK